MLPTLDETLHGREPNAAVHFDFLYVGKSAVDVGLDAVDGCQYVLIILENVSGYTWFRSSKACTVNETIQELIRCCATFEQGREPRG